MAEPKNLEEAIVAYEENRFSRKSLLRFIVDRLKANEANLVRLEEQYRVMVSAIVNGSQAASTIMEVDPVLAAASMPDRRSRSEKMKESWAKRKAAASGVGEALTNG